MWAFTQLCPHRGVIAMSTSRVPGVTRNSGWLNVDALILEARVRRQQLSDPTPVKKAELLTVG